MNQPPAKRVRARTAGQPLRSLRAPGALAAAAHHLRRHVRRRGRAHLVHRHHDRPGPDEHRRRCAAVGRGANPGGAGQLRLLAGNLPVYLCSLRDEAQQLLAILAVLCRPSGRAGSQDPRLHLRLLAARTGARVPAARPHRARHHRGAEPDRRRPRQGPEPAAAQGAAEPAVANADGASELQQLLQQTIEHLHALTGALLVPEKSVTLVRSGGGCRPRHPVPDARAPQAPRAGAVAARAGDDERHPVSPANPEAFPYRVLCCALRSRAGRSIGVLALLREPSAEAFSERDAHIAEILARKAIGVIESSYDPLSGLYTRAAFERRVRAAIAERKPSQPWSALYIDVDQLHAINEKSGMHVGDAVLGQLGELVRQRLPPGGFGARISGDRFVVLLPAADRRCRALRRVAARGRRAACRCCRARTRTPVSISVGVALLDAERGGARARTGRRRDRLQGRQGSRPQSRRALRAVRRQHRAPLRRHRHRRAAARAPSTQGRLHLDAQLILPFAAAESARPHYELLLRMTDEKGKHGRPGQLPLRRDPLPADAGDRPLGGQPRHRCAAAARRRARGPGARLLRSTSPASPSTTTPSATC